MSQSANTSKEFLIALMSVAPSRQQSTQDKGHDYQLGIVRGQDNRREIRRS
jgi:hypothetical protein